MGSGTRTVTILFTDVVSSTELLQRAGDDHARRVFQVHQRLLREAVQAHGGEEVKWLGDGLMVAFSSSLDAVRCAIAMQQASRRPAAGERLEIRAGLNVGEALTDESDYFGTSVVVARRLCDRAGPGQILASDMVVRLFEGHGAGIDVKDLGHLDLKGITNAIPTVEITYRPDPLALLRKLPFVGRKAEYETLLRKLDEATKGSGSVTLLAGEPGIGKTRLTEEFCEQASSSARIIRGNCYEGDMAPPFGPWIEALRSLTGQITDDELSAALGDGAPDLAVMLPEVLGRLPNVEGAPKLDPESERARLFQSIGAFLHNASEQRPLVIFLDDLHWADRPSLALLEAISRRIPEDRALVVGTYRDVEVDRVHPLSQTLSGLRRMEHHERILVRGFGDESVVDLLTAIEADAPTNGREALATLLRVEANGNPFFIREVLNNLVETGKLVYQDDAWVTAAGSIDELAIPEGVKEVVGRRLSRLSEGCNRMLGRACALTSGFTWSELQAICDEPEEQLLDWLDEALASQLLRERGQLAYEFTHALIRGTLYDELSAPRRVMLHRRVAESFEVLYADDMDAHLGELASHYLASAGGEAQKAVDYSIRAGDRAMELLAWEEAAAHYEHAVEAMGLTKNSQADDRRFRTLLDLGRALRNAGQRPASIAAFGSAAEVARTMEAAELLGEAALGFEEAGANIPGDPLLPMRRLHIVDEALGALGAGDSAIRARLLAQRTRAAQAVAGGDDPVRSAGFGQELGHKDPALTQQSREAVAIAERLGDPAVIAAVLSPLFWRLAGPAHRSELRQIAERLVECSQRAGQVQREADGWHLVFVAAMAQGELAAARAAHGRADGLTSRLRTANETRATLVRRANLLLVEGRLDDAEGAMREALAFGQGIDDHTAPYAFGAQLTLLRWYQGRAAELVPMWQSLAEQSPDIETFQAVHALALIDAGHMEAASQVVATLASRGFASVPEDLNWGGAMSCLVEVSARLDDVASAAQLWDVISQHAEGDMTIGDTVDFGPVVRLLGLLATMLKRWDEAEQHFRDALGQCEANAYLPMLAYTRLNYATMLLRRAGVGDREKARGLLQQSIVTTSELGMAKVRSDAERLLAAAGAVS